MIQRQVYHDVAAKVRKWLQNDEPYITFGKLLKNGSTHALDEMAKDEITFADMLHALRGCRVTDLRLEGNEWRYLAEGKDVDGRGLVFVLNLFDEREEIEVVTAWCKKREKK